MSFMLRVFKMSICVVFIFLYGCSSSPEKFTPSPGESVHITSDTFEKLVDLNAKGDVVAKSALGILYKDGKLIHSNYDAARELLIEAANQGDSQAEYIIGLMHGSGEWILHIRKEYEKFQWVEKSALHGYPEAMYMMGNYYGTGGYCDGCPKQDLEKAFVWWFKAMLSGNLKAKLSICKAYSSGKGIQKDLKRAFNCFYELADRDYAGGAGNNPFTKTRFAKFYVCKAFDKGIGIEKNIDKAIGCYLELGELGYKKAALKLGNYFDSGLDVKEDLVLAYMWYRIAKDFSYIYVLKKRMSPEDIMQGERLVSLWTWSHSAINRM